MRRPPPPPFLVVALAVAVVSGGGFAQAREWAPRKGTAATAAPKKAGGGAKKGGLEAARRFAADRAAGVGGPADPATATRYAQALAAGGDCEAAAAVLADTLGVPPRPGKERRAAVRLYAKVLTGCGRLSAFAPSLTRLYAAEPSPEELRVLVDVSFDLGDGPTTVDALKKLVAADPSDRAAAERLAGLQVVPETRTAPPARSGPLPVDSSPGVPVASAAVAAAAVDPGVLDAAGWSRLVSSGDLKALREAARQYRAEESRRAALAMAALALSDTAGAREHLAAGVAVVRGIGSPDDFAVELLIRVALRVDDVRALAELAETALYRCRSGGTLSAALEAAGRLAGVPQAGRGLEAVLAGSVSNPDAPPRDAVIKALVLIAERKEASANRATPGLKDALTTSLATSDPALRRRVARLIVEGWGADGVHTVLRRSLEDGEPIGAADLAFLGSAGQPDAVPAIARTFDRLSPFDRSAAVLAAAVLGGDAARTLLLRAVADERAPAAAGLAAIALGATGDEAVRPALTRAAGRPAVSDGARLGLALLGGGPNVHHACTEGGFSLLRAAATREREAAVGTLLACAWHPSVAPGLLPLVLEAAGDPAAWRTRARAETLRIFAFALETWPLPGIGPRWVLDELSARADAAGAVVTLEGRDDRVVEAARKALGDPVARRTILADLSGALPGRQSGLLGMLREAGRGAVAARVREER